jgi:hypothetical protein
MFGPNNFRLEPKKEGTSMVSPAKSAANRGNAKHSTGPRTAEGKSRSSQNATSHGYFCQHLVLPGEDPALFDEIRENFIDDLSPQTLSELLIVDRIAIAAWKLRRMQESGRDLHDSKVEELIDLAKVVVTIPPKELNKFTYHAQGVCRTVLEAADPAMTASQSTSAALVDRRNDRSLDRLSQLEQRLENTIIRCHRELRQMRKDKPRLDDLPPSPYSRRQMESLPERYEAWREQLRPDSMFKPVTFDQMQRRAWQNDAKRPAPVEKVKNEPTSPAQGSGLATSVASDVDPRATIHQEIDGTNPPPVDPTDVHTFTPLEDFINQENKPTANPGSDQEMLS